jgi:hypothetical protein
VSACHPTLRSVGRASSQPGAAACSGVLPVGFAARPAA